MIPDYQTLMLPLLKLVSDGQAHQYRNLIENLAVQFEVLDAERKELLASGNQSIFDIRVGWAKIYLKKQASLNHRSGQHLHSLNFAIMPGKKP